MNYREIFNSFIAGLTAPAIIALLAVGVGRVGHGNELARATNEATARTARVTAKLEQSVGKIEKAQQQDRKRLAAPVSWEYTTASIVVTTERTGNPAAKNAYIQFDASEMTRQHGAKGWELVTCYLEMETAFPNFGDDKFVIGIKSNVRPSRLVLIFKRRAQE